MAAYDQPLAASMLALFFLLVLILVFKKIGTLSFTAAVLPTLILFIYFSVGYRITEMSLASGTIKLASDQAQRYAGEIRDVRDKVIEESKSIAIALENGKKTDGILAQIAKKNEAAEKNLEKIEQEIGKSEKLLSKLQQETDFDSLVFSAQSDDRQSFARLKILADDFNSPYRARASAAWKSIRTQVNAVSGMRMTYQMSWAPGFDPKSLGYDAVTQMFFQSDRDSSGADFELRSALLDYISGREDFSKDQRLLFLMQTMRITNSLKIFANAALDFDQISGAKANDLTSIDFFEEWWRNHPHL